MRDVAVAAAPSARVRPHATDSASGTEQWRSPQRGRQRWLRAGWLGGSSLAIAAGAHLTGGGQLPPAAVLLVLTLLVGTTAVALTSRRLTAPALLAVLGLEQLALHHVFAATAGLSSAGCADVVVPHHGTATLPAGCAGLVDGAAAAPGSAVAGTSMWLTHVAATVLTAWLLARGEARLWALADRVHAVADAAPGSWPTRPRQPARPLVVARSWVDFPSSAASPRAPPAAGL